MSSFSENEENILSVCLGVGQCGLGQLSGIENGGGGNQGRLDLLLVAPMGKFIV